MHHWISAFLEYAASIASLRPVSPSTQNRTSSTGAYCINPHLTHICTDFFSANFYAIFSPESIADPSRPNLKQYTKQITLKLLSSIAMVSTSYLCKIFTIEYKISPIQYVNNLRIMKSKELMM
jgi:AraC-like DNA-binding protein